jgi:TRAP transporter TAXI family solute receptor
MKNLLKTLTAGVIALGLSSAGQAAENDLKMATIAPGSSAYLTMTTMATLVNQSLDGEVNISVDATGAATKHMIELAQGKLDLCMSSPVIYEFLKAGTAMYKKIDNAPELAENVQLIMWFPLGSYHFVTYAEDGLTSLEDLRGKKVFLGPPGGGAWAAAHGWVEALTGMKAGDDYENVKASWSSALQGFQDRQFDVYVTSGIAPFPQVEQLAQTSELRLLGLSKDAFEASEPAKDLTIRKNGRELGVIKAGVYGDGVVNETDVYTLGSIVGVSARADLDEEVVYEITKAFWESAEAARANTPWLAELNTEYAIQEGGMKLHPGALRYYDEIGVAVPEGSR